MTQKLIGISARVDFVEEYGEFRDSVDHRLERWVLEWGAIPVIIPNIAYRGSIQFFLGRVPLDGFVLSGGGDIGSSRDRDGTEKEILEFAFRESLPVLGICRGMQMMAHLFGERAMPVDEHSHNSHLVRLEDGTERNVNSFHQRAILACPQGFSVFAEAGDGVIEGIKHIRLPWEGWMWHPERDECFSKADLDRAMDLFQTGGL